MEHITADYWKGIVKGVVSTFLVTFLITAQTAIVKYGGTLGFVSAVIITFRGIVQVIICLLESVFSINKITKKRECNPFRIIADIKSVGILPRRTRIPLFDDSGILSRSDLSLDHGLGSSYSLLSTNSDDPVSPAAKFAPITPYPVTPSAKDTETTYMNIDTINTGGIKVIDKPTTPGPSTSTKAINFNVHKRKPRTKNYRCLIWTAILIRGFFGGISCLLCFEASILLPVGDYQAFLALAATITPIFAFIVFKDTLSKLHSISLIGAVVGVTFIIQPPFMFHSNESISRQMIYGYICTFGGCIANACIYTSLQFARKVPIYILSMSQSIFCIITGIVVLSFNHQLTDKHTHWIDNWFDCGYALSIGLSGYAYIWLLTLSGRYLSSGVVALLVNLSIVWGYIVQILVFDDMPDWITMIGATCLFLSVVIVSVDKVSDAKKKSMSVIVRNMTTHVGAV